jgi:hypothetical protein
VPERAERKKRKEEREREREREREVLKNINFFIGLKGLQIKIFAAGGEKVRSKRKENFFGLRTRLVNPPRSMMVKSDRPIRDINESKIRKYQKKCQELEFRPSEMRDQNRRRKRACGIY